MDSPMESLGLIDFDKKKKEVEKRLIKEIVAPQSIQTSKTDKQLVKNMEQSRVKRLNDSCANFTTEFKTKAKGKWVTEASVLFKEASEKMTSIVAD